MISQATQSVLCCPVATIKMTICHLSYLNKVSSPAAVSPPPFLPPSISLPSLPSFQRATLRCKERKKGGGSGGGEDSHKQQKRITYLMFKDEQLCSPSTRPRDAVCCPFPVHCGVSRLGDKVCVCVESFKDSMLVCLGFFLLFQQGSSYQPHMTFLLGSLIKELHKPAYTEALN